MTKTDATTRKQAQRQRDKSVGINEIRARLEPEEYAMLTEGMAARRLFRPAYDLPEYIALLIRQDNQRLKEQLAELGILNSSILTKRFITQQVKYTYISIN
ncbi:putative GP46 protein [Yersinia thracica]|uniref:Putative GP46 protein n=1 Tax=Yersinia thracica TaxID=2890319 RepID=A0A0T9P2V1_9GAMM|nr:hypothetical protein [Yersinia thracica]CNH43080.1 putative GP46 protein [Yersinia thracica]